MFILIVFFAVSYMILKNKMDGDEQVASQRKELPNKKVAPQSERIACDTYSSEKEVMESAISTGNEKICSCVRDKSFKDACQGVVLDLNLYSQALRGHDENLCNEMVSESRKSACFAAVKNSIPDLYKSDVTQWSSCENGKQLAMNWTNKTRDGGENEDIDLTRDCNGKCGTANAKEYNATDSSFGEFQPCAVGTSNPSNPFPEPGNNNTWICEGLDGGRNSENCVASRKFYTCSGDFPNATPCSGDSGDLIVPTKSILVDSCNVNQKCKYVCDSSRGYRRQNNICVK